MINETAVKFLGLSDPLGKYILRPDDRQNARSRHKEDLWSYKGSDCNSVITEVMVLILISSLVAYQIAFFGIKIWLESFAEKINVSPLIYIVASVIGLAIG